jgi:hypothetical protein
MGMSSNFIAWPTHRRKAAVRRRLRRSRLKGFGNA